MAGTSCKRVDAFLKNRQEPIAAQLHRLAVDRSQLARVLMDDDDGASNVSIVFLTTPVPNYRDLGPTFKSHQVVERLNFKGGSYV